MKNSQSRCSFFTSIRTKLEGHSGHQGGEWKGAGLTCWSSSFRMESSGGKGVTSQEEEEKEGGGGRGAAAAAEGGGEGGGPQSEDVRR